MCGCRKNLASARSTPALAPATGYKVTFPDGTKDVFLTPLEAKRAVRKAGGGEIRACREDCYADAA
jgi:hypothetical protein